MGCEHGRVRSKCKECGGSQICEHGRHRQSCKDCNGCSHGRLRSKCKECGGSSICEHRRQRFQCNVCTPKKKCSLCPKLTRTKSGLCASCNKEQKAKAQRGNVEGNAK